MSRQKTQQSWLTTSKLILISIVYREAQLAFAIDLLTSEAYNLVQGCRGKIEHTQAVHVPLPAIRTNYGRSILRLGYRTPPKSCAGGEDADQQALENIL